MKIEEVKRPAIAGSQTQDTSGLSHQCSATEPQQPHNHQPSQSSMCTAQVVLNASVTHLAATQFVPSELRGRLENSFHQRRISPSGNPPSGKNPISLYFHLITSKFISFYRDAPKLQQSIVIRRGGQPDTGGYHPTPVAVSCRHYSVDRIQSAECRTSVKGGAHTRSVYRLVRVYVARMSPALNGSSTLRMQKIRSNYITITYETSLEIPASLLSLMPKETQWLESR